MYLVIQIDLQTPKIGAKIDCEVSDLGLYTILKGHYCLVNGLMSYLVCHTFTRCLDARYHPPEHKWAVPYPKPTVYIFQIFVNKVCFIFRGVLAQKKLLGHFFEKLSCRFVTHWNDYRIKHGFENELAIVSLPHWNGLLYRGCTPIIDKFVTIFVLAIPKSLRNYVSGRSSGWSENMYVNWWLTIK